MKKILTKEKLLNDINEELFSLKFFSMLISASMLLMFIINSRYLPKEVYILILLAVVGQLFVHLYKHILFFAVKHDKFRISTDSVFRKYEEEKICWIGPGYRKAGRNNEYEWITFQNNEYGWKTFPKIVFKKSKKTKDVSYKEYLNAEIGDTFYIIKIGFIELLYNERLYELNHELKKVKK